MRIKKLVAFILASFVFFAFLTPFVQAAPCNPTMSFDVTDVNNKSIGQIPLNGDIIVKLNVAPQGDCAQTVVEDAVVNFVIQGKTSFGAKLSLASGSATLGTTGAQYSSKIQANGLKNTSGGVAKSGDSVQLQGAIKLAGETSYRNTSTKSLTISKALSCGELYFDVTDPKTGKSVRQVPVDGDVILYIKVTYDINYCPLSATSIERVVVNQVVNGKTEYIGDAKQSGSGPSYLDFKLQWQVGGLKDTKTGQTVKPGGSVQLQGALKSFSDTNYRGSSIVSVGVTEAGSKPVLGGGGDAGNVGGGGTPDYSGVASINVPTDLNSIGDVISTLIKVLLTGAAAFAVLYIMIGGFKMVVSGGSEESITSGKKTVQWAVIGLIVTIMAFTIVSVLQSILQKR